MEPRHEANAGAGGGGEALPEEEKKGLKEQNICQESRLSIGRFCFLLL
jgi:hypothetical protein